MLCTLILSLISLVRPLPDDIALSIDTVIAADSLDASHALVLPYEAAIRAAANDASIPAPLLAGIVQEESRFEEWATRMEPHYFHSATVRRAARQWSVHHAGLPTPFTEQTDRARSYGLTQIMGETARREGYGERYLASLFSPGNELRAGAHHLHLLLQKYRRDTLSAISAYNQGTSRKHAGAFTNARYVYRVAIAWRLYDVLMKGQSHGK